MPQIYRVVVRGQFDKLDDTTRARLLEEVAEHHFLRSAFTADGTLTYDRQLAAFNLRYEVRSDVGASDESERLIEQAAIERAGRWLDRTGIPHKRLRASATNMASMWR